MEVNSKLSTLRKIIYLLIGTIFILFLLMGFYWFFFYGKVRGRVSCENVPHDLSFSIKFSDKNKYNSLKISEYSNLNYLLLKSYVVDTTITYENLDGTYDKIYHFSNLIKNNRYELFYDNKKLMFKILKIDTIYHNDGFSLIPECKVGLIEINGDELKLNRYVDITKYDFK